MKHAITDPAKVEAATRNPKFSTVISELKACTSSKNLKNGKRIHQTLIERGDDTDAFVACTLINMYAKCGSMNDAMQVFKIVRHRDVVTWNALILGYADNGEGYVALDFFFKMRHESCRPDERTFLGAVKACIGVSEHATGDDILVKLRRAKKIHLLVMISGYDSDHFLECTLVDLYMKCGLFHDAYLVFCRMKKRDVATWTALILGYANNGESEVGLELFSTMIHNGVVPDARAFVAALKASAQLHDSQKCLQHGKEIHFLAISNGCASDPYVQCTLLDMYAKCGNIGFARQVFDSVHHRDIASWTAIILAYAENGKGDIAMDMFMQMRFEGFVHEARTLVAVLKACSSLIENTETKDRVSLIEKCRAVHLLASRRGYDFDVYVQNSLVDMYSKCGDIQESRKMFRKMEIRTVVSWNALILGYAENNQGAKGLECFSEMRKHFSPDISSILAALSACSDISEDGVNGSVIHLLASSSGFDEDFHVQSSLVDMYSKCGCMENAHKVFKGMQYRDVVTWTSLILGYIDKGEGEIALNLFSRMRREGCTPDARALVAALKACALLGALEYGRSVYTEICTKGFNHDAILVTCVVDFYAKCGSLVEAKQVFDSSVTKEVSSWNALIAGYSRQGDTNAVFEIFRKMEHAKVKPDSVNFLCVLTACSHAGLVDRGRYYFEAMSRTYGIERGLEHYACMVDIFARSNKLDEAMALVRTMDFTPTPMIWNAVMGACRKWKNVELGRIAFESLLSFDHQHAEGYVLMANIYGLR